MEPKDRIAVALDVNDPEKAIALIEQLSPHVGFFKLGMQLAYTILGGLVSCPDEEVAKGNLRIARKLFALLRRKFFLDLKGYDIANTMAGAGAAMAAMEPAFFNVHASADIDGMAEAVANKGNSKVLAVTVLTSLGDEVTQLIYGASPAAKVLQLARFAKLAEVDGLICSPQEVPMLRKRRELKGLILGTPGIRPKWAVKGDQDRISTPGGAIEAGADFLVIGRPITDPPAEIGNPVAAAELIAEEIATALQVKK